jgi:hypothetical protein
MRQLSEPRSLMKNLHSTKWTEEDIDEFARDIGKPLPVDLKKRIMEAVDASAVELSKGLKKSRKKSK